MVVKAANWKNFSDINKTFNSTDKVGEKLVFDIKGNNYRLIGIVVFEAAYEMSLNKIGSMVVVDDHGEVFGIFTTTDALNALIEIVRGEVDL